MVRVATPSRSRTAVPSSASPLRKVTEPPQLKSREDLIVARQYLGACYHLMDDKVKAKAQFSMLLALDPKQPIARFAEVTDRNAAEALRGQLVTVPRSALPPLEEGEYYHADLIGLPCESPQGESLGHVVAVENFGAGDLLEIERPDGRRALIPFRAGVADFADGRIVLDAAFLA